MEDEVVPGKISYEQDGIFIHICDSEDDTLYNGKLMVVEKPYGVCVEWHQLEETDYSLEQVHEWSMVNATVGYKADKTNDADVCGRSSKCRKRQPISFELLDLKSFKYSHQKQGWPHITFLLKDGTTHSPMHFHSGCIFNFIETLKKFIKIKQSPLEPNLWLVIDPKVEALEKSFNELQLFSERKGRIVSKFFQDPYTVTLGGFSKVTKFLYDYMVTDGIQLASPDDDDIIGALHESLPGLDVNNQEEPGFELITRNDLIPRPKIKREGPMTPEDWASHIDPDGRILRVTELKQRIFRGGIDPSLRSEVWKFLLGCSKYDSTFNERKEIKKQLVDDYYRMKLQWKTISEDQERRFSDLREKKNLIEKDVSRTDRTHPFFVGAGNENIQILYDILMTYCMYNFDLGYVQGMSDLLSPILVVMQNEVDSFWCFVGFMNKVFHNFEMDQQGMKTQLQHVYDLLHFIDPQLCEYLERHDSGNLFFCFRWLLIIFKREFKFQDIMRLWEVLWTDLPCKNFHLLFCLAVLDTEKHTLMENKFGFTEILKHINDLSLSIKLEDNLVKAEGIYMQLAACHYLPQSIQDIVGITTPPEPAIEAVVSESEGDTVSSTSPMTIVNRSPQSNTSSVETSSIELLSDLETELRYQTSLDLQYM